MRGIRSSVTVMNRVLFSNVFHESRRVLKRLCWPLRLSEVLSSLRTTLEHAQSSYVA